MKIEDLNRKTRQILENAVEQWINGDFQPMADLIGQIQQESYLEGYIFAIEVLESHVRNNSTTEQSQKEDSYNDR